MGTYINPRTMSKEAWLSANGTRLSTVPTNYRTDDSIVVCLVDNGLFTAAGVAIDQRELEAFSYSGDPRPKAWFLVPISIVEAEVGKLP